jgi:hypothetical protein
MSRAVLILANDEVRNRATDWCKRAPAGTRVEFKGPKRSLEQSAKMWAMLTDIATQKLHHGRRFPAETWKVLFMDALGREVEWVPSLDGQQAIPIGHHSSDLSKEEMSELIECIAAWGAEHGVVFHDPTLAREAA